MNEQDLKKYRIVIETKEAVTKDPKFAFDILGAALQGIEELRLESMKKNANIHLIVMNLKPEYLEEMKKLIIPDVFESLGIDVGTKYDE